MCGSSSGAFKAPGGLIRVMARLHDHRIDDISLSGDFTMLPALAVGALEQSLRGVEVREGPAQARIEDVYRSLGVQSPGVTPDHFVQAILAAAGAERA